MRLSSDDTRTRVQIVEKLAETVPLLDALTDDVNWDLKILIWMDVGTIKLVVVPFAIKYIHFRVRMKDLPISKRQN